MKKAAVVGAPTPVGRPPGRRTKPTLMRGTSRDPSLLLGARMRGGTGRRRLSRTRCGCFVIVPRPTARAPPRPATCSVAGQNTEISRVTGAANFLPAPHRANQVAAPRTPDRFRGEEPRFARHPRMEGADRALVGPSRRALMLVRCEQSCLSRARMSVERAALLQAQHAALAPDIAASHVPWQEHGRQRGARVPGCPPPAVVVPQRRNWRPVPRDGRVLRAWTAGVLSALGERGVFSRPAAGRREEREPRDHRDYAAQARAADDGEGRWRTCTQRRFPTSTVSST